VADARQIQNATLTGRQRQGHARGQPRGVYVDGEGAEVVRAGC
jgi:hypothetical protein